MIHIERVVLPDGLRALAHRDARGNQVIYVSQALDAASQRGAVMEAVRALRRTGWRAGVPTAGIALLVAFRSMTGRVARVISAHPAAWGSTAATAIAGTAAAGFFLITAPQPHDPAASGGQPGPVPSVVVPSLAPGQHATHPAQPRQGAPAQPGALISPGPAGTGLARQPDTGHGNPQAPSPSPAPPTTSPPPSPTPSPAPSPSPTGNGNCISLLGIHVCLRL